MKAKSSPSAGWPAPTRRAFVGMIGAAAAILAAGRAVPAVEEAGLADRVSPEPDNKWPWMKTRWVGHC